MRAPFNNPDNDTFFDREFTPRELAGMAEFDTAYYVLHSRSAERNTYQQVFTDNNCCTWNYEYVPCKRHERVSYFIADACSIYRSRNDSLHVLLLLLCQR